MCAEGEKLGVADEFTRFGQVDEGADACGEESVQLGTRGTWCPGIFAGL